jgi:hypothetical protein
MKKMINFRLSCAVLGALRASVAKRQRAGFIRQAIDSYLELPKQPIENKLQADIEPQEFEQVAALVASESLDKLRQMYPDVSSSVVIEVALLRALDSAA